MSLRSSSINSSLFMSDPVPIKDQNAKYLIKGDEVEMTDNSGTKEENNSANQEDFIVVTSEGGSFQLHRKTLREMLLELKKDSHVSIKQLNPGKTQSFTSIVETLRLLYNSNDLYDLVLKDVHEIFSNVSNIKPGTVAAFFLGCSNDNKFDGPMGCDPKCAASLPPSEGTPEYANCNDLVLLYDNGGFSSLNDVGSQHAYIYIENNNFQGFTEENIKQLKDAGIQESTLVFGGPDGSYKEIRSPVKIDALPQVVSVNEQQQPTVTQSSGAGAAVFIVIIIVVLLLIAFAFSRYGGYM